MPNQKTKNKKKKEKKKKERKKEIWFFEYVNTGPRVFLPSHPNFNEKIAYHREYRLLLFLAIDQVLNILHHFEILRWKSKEKFENVQ